MAIFEKVKKFRYSWIRSQTGWKWASRSGLFALALLGASRAPGFFAAAFYLCFIFWLIQAPDARIRRQCRVVIWMFFLTAPVLLRGVVGAGQIHTLLYITLAALGVVLLGIPLLAYTDPPRIYRALAPLVFLSVVAALWGLGIPSFLKLGLLFVAAWTLITEVSSFGKEPKGVAVKPLLEGGIGALVITELVWAASFLPWPAFYLGIWASLLFIAVDRIIEMQRNGLAGKQLVLEKILILSGFLVLLLLASLTL